MPAKKFQPWDLGNLNRESAKSTRDDLAIAASLIEHAFKGYRIAWLGGFALNLRGSERTTQDIDIIIAAENNGIIRRVLERYDWAIMGAYDLSGSVQEKVFVNINENGKLVAVDIILAGKLDTPPIGENPDGAEKIVPAFDTPQGSVVSVISLKWQVETKMKAYMGRAKQSDYQDLAYLFKIYSDQIQNISSDIDEELRNHFYQVYKGYNPDEKLHKTMQEILHLTPSSTN